MTRDSPVYMDPGGRRSEVGGRAVLARHDRQTRGPDLEGAHPRISGASGPRASPEDWEGDAVPHALHEGDGGFRLDSESPGR